MNENNNKAKSQSAESFSAIDLFRLCISHWYLYIICAAIGFGCAAYNLHKATKIYSRTTSVLVKNYNEKNEFSNSKNLLEEEEGMFTQSIGLSTLKRHIKSLEVLSAAAIQAGIADSTNVMSKARTISSRLKVGSEKSASVLNITLTGPNPKQDEKILYAIVDVFNKKWIQDKNKVAETTSNFITERIAELEHDLDHVDDSISRILGEQQVLNISGIGTRPYAKYSNTESEIFSLKGQKTIANYILRLLSESTKHIEKGSDMTHRLLPSHSGINNSVAEAQINQYNNLLMEISNHLLYTTPQNPQMQVKEKQLAEIKSSIVKTINSQIEALDIRLAAIQGRNNDAAGELREAPGQAKRLTAIERQQKVKESLYLSLLQKLEENEIKNTYSANVLFIIDAPNGSKTPISPVPNNVYIGVLLTVLLLPTIFLFLREVLNTSVRGKFDLEGKVSAPIIGEIPMNERTSMFNRMMLWRKKPESAKVVINAKSNNLINEAFRVVRTNMEFLTNEQNTNGNTYIVTSSYPGSGKTFVSMNLALTLALRDKRVLFIDGDLRHASASRYWKCPKEGLSSYLSGRTDDLQSLIQYVETSVNEGTGEMSPNLSVLPVGTIPPNPTELLSSDRLGKALEQLRPLYDFIIIDCPPVESLADTGLIEKHADRTLFIVRAGLYQRNRVIDLETTYQSNRFKHMSIILNAVEVGSRYGYKYGYRYGYKYGYGNGYYSS